MLPFEQAKTYRDLLSLFPSTNKNFPIRQSQYSNHLIGYFEFLILEKLRKTLSDKENKNEIIRNGFSDYLTKPIDKTELTAKLEVFVD